MSNRITDEWIALHAASAWTPEIHAMAVEIQERRAMDLTPGEVETVREMLVEFESNHSAWEGGTEDVQTICRKILRAHGIGPEGTP